MSDAAPAAGAGEVTGGDGVVTDGGSASTPQTPEWMGILPDDLKADPTLSRFADVEALSRGHLETQKLARSKFAVPADDAPPEAWNDVWDKLGRPADKKDYNLAMPELPVDATDEHRAALNAEFDPFRDLAHEIGLTDKQANALTAFELKRQEAFYAKGAEEVDALKEQLGRDYEPKRKAAEQVFAKIFGDDDEAKLLAADMDKKVGSGRFVKGMMRLAEIAGEHKLVDSDHVEGFGEVADAEAKIRELQADAGWRQRFEAGDAGTVAQHKRLMALAVQQAARPRK